MPRTSRSVRVRVVTSVDLSRATVQVALTGGNDQKSLTEFATRLDAITALRFSRLEIDLTAVDLLPPAAVQMLLALHERVTDRQPAELQILCRPSSMTARALELSGFPQPRRDRSR